MTEPPSMALLLKNDSVFLHIPKTGGTWVRSVLQEFDLVKGSLGHGHSDFERAYWHSTLHHDLKVVRYILRRWIHSPRAQLMMKPGTFMFCFIREPLGWYESWWRFMMSIDWRILGDESDPHKWHPNAMLNGLGSPDFNTFMHNVNRKRPGYVTEMYGWYIRPGVNFVGKMEQMVPDLAKAFALMSIPISEEKIKGVARQNESPSHIAKPQWDPKVKAETLRLEYAGYVRYGYPFDEALLAAK